MNTSGVFSSPRNTTAFNAGESIETQLPRFAIDLLAMQRRVFDAIGKTSLVICGFIAATWGLSYFVGLGWRFFSQDTQHSWTSDLETVRGGIQFRHDIRPPYTFIVSHGPRGHRSARDPWTPTHLGFGFTSFRYQWVPGYAAKRIVIVVPFYPIFILAAVPSFLWIAAVRRRALLRWRIRHGCCIQCGYDLVGNTSDRCPECGAACNAASPAGASLASDILNFPRSLIN